MPDGKRPNRIRTFTDQLGRDVAISWPPERIISLVPSQTELLFDLGLDREVVGLTRFCVHPGDKYRTLPRVGGTKKIHKDKIDALRPDLIIANKEENVKEQIEALAADYPVWLSDISSLDDALDMIRAIATITDRDERGKSIIDRIRSARADLREKLTHAGQKPRVAYLIWRQPYMVAASETFIDCMIREAGFINAFDHQSRYPVVSASEIHNISPDLIFLSSEPYPFKEAHLKEFQDICPQARIVIVDGELFSWYGSRLIRSFPYFWSLRKEL